MARVLVADDHPDIVALVSAVLEIAGHDVSTAGDGEEAVRKAMNERPQMIVLDIMMPRMDGLAALARLRVNPPTDEIPMLFLSAKTDPADRERGLAAGAQGYLTKPFKPNGLIAEISRILARSPAAPR